MYFFAPSCLIFSWGGAFKKMHLENILSSHFWDFKGQRAFKNKIYHISGVYHPILFKICVQVAKRLRLMVSSMAFVIKGQRKAAETFEGINAVYWSIFLKICMQVAHWPILIVCYMAFEIKGQTKATVALKGVWPLFDLLFQRPCNKLLTEASGLPACKFWAKLVNKNH